MRWVLALVPYVGSAALYYVISKDLFARAQGVMPDDLSFQLVAPVVVAGFIPLAVSANTSGSNVAWLASASVVSMGIAVILLATLRDRKRFTRLFVPRDGILGRHVIGRRLLVALGVIAICYGGAVNQIVAGDTGSSTKKPKVSVTRGGGIPRGSAAARTLRQGQRVSAFAVFAEF
jgi:hypothetical protein